MSNFSVVINWSTPTATFSDLTGKTLTEVHGLETGNDRVLFVTSEGPGYILYHDQNCCESVGLEEVDGDSNDLVGEPILFAEEISNENRAPISEYDESYEWTFYRIGTIKGTVVMRWYGTSNGYYSTSVDFSTVESYKINE